MPDERNGPNLTLTPTLTPALPSSWRASSRAAGTYRHCSYLPTHQEGVIEYCWDMLFLSVFVQLGTGFLSDWLWLVYTVPPAIGLYYLWVKIIYPWISKPDEDPNAGQEPKMKMKKGR